MIEVFYVGAAGFFGAISRFFFYKLEAKIPLNTFPYATLAVNLLGCLLLGICLGYGEKALPQHKQMLALFSMGFIGSFTTFSAFSSETLNLLQNQLWSQAFGNITLNVVLGIVMVFLGKHLMAMA